jgi:hypothetical protein
MSNLPDLGSQYFLDTFFDVARFVDSQPVAAKKDGVDGDLDRLAIRNYSGTLGGA